MTVTWQSDHPEDFVGPQGIRMGCGWVQEHPEHGYVVVDHEQEAYAVLPHSSQRALALDDARARREQAEEDAAAEDRAWDRVLRLRSQGFEPRSMTETFAHVARRMDSADRNEQARLRMGLSSGELYAEPTPAPSLRSQQLTMRRQQQERAETAASRVVQGSELDDLKAEVQHLKAQLHARGQADDPDPVVGYRAVRGGELPVRSSQVLRTRQGGDIVSVR